MRPEKGGTLLKGLLLSLRLRQWIKNFVIFAGLLFSGKYRELEPLGRVLLAFGFFCLLSGGCYLINDAMDAEKDRRHPLKRLRPVAAGAVPRWVALAVGLLLTGVGIAGCFLLGWWTAMLALGYFFLGTLYTVWLKEVVLLDVLAIAAGFVLRALAGAVAIPVPISPWLIVCTVQLALFLALAKRRCEMVSLGSNAGDHRGVLTEYSTALLDQLIAIVTSSTVIAYSLYTISDRTYHQLGTAYMPLTIPFVVYGVFRYLYLIHRESANSQAEAVLMTDRPLLLCVALWALTCMVLIGWGR